MGDNTIVKAFLQLPKGTPYRLDWLGNVIYYRHIRYSQPFISVALSELPAEGIDAWEYPGDFEVLPQQRHIWLPVGFLPSLRVGEVWMNGSVAQSPKYVTETFALDISPSRTSLIKAGLSKEHTAEFVLPFRFHPYHKEHTHSYCVQVTIDWESRLVIPATELIRFYFGSSSNLVAQLFKVPFCQESFWTAATKDDHGLAFIDLAEGLSGYSAADVARIAFNANAMNAAKLISSSCCTASVSRERIYPRAAFPFTGKTDLRVNGIWIRSPGTTMKTFLAFQIESCSHPFPFTSLGYSFKKKHIQVSGGPPEGGGALANMRWKSKREPSRPLSEQPPSSKLGQIRLADYHHIRFPDLMSKTILRTDPTTPGTVLCADAPEGLEGWAVGDGEGETHLRPVDLVDAGGAPAPKSHPAAGGLWWRLVSAFSEKLMEAFPVVQFVPLDARQRFPQISTMPQMVNGDGEIHPLCLVDQGDHARARHVAILRFAGDGGCGLAIFPEVIEDGGNTTEPAVLFLYRSDMSITIDGQWLLRMLSELLWKQASDRTDMLEIEMQEPIEVPFVADQMLNHCLSDNSPYIE